MGKKQENQTIRVRAPQTFREAIPSWLLLIGLAVTCVLFFILNPSVFSMNSIASILATASMQGILSLSLMFVMTTGTFDLSAGMKAALAASIVGYMCADGLTMGNYVLSIILGIAAAALMSLIHSVLTVTLQIPGFIAALALRLLLQAVVAVFTNNAIFYSNDWGETYKVLGQGTFLGIPYPFYIFLALCVVCWIFMERTRTGRHIYATGANQTAAKQVGIQTEKLRYLSFIIGGVVAAISGILYSSRNFYTSVDMGLNLQMPAMTCCLLGATFFEPGKYNVPGCLVGALFSSVLTTGIFSIFTAGAWLNYFVQGVVFLLALGLIAKTRAGGLSKVTFDM